jgi:hypothetical protein
LTRRLAFVLTISIVVVLVVLNVVGVLRYPGGPLTESDGAFLWLDFPSPDQPRNGISMPSAADMTTTELMDVGSYLRTGSGMAATIESVRLFDPTPGIVLVDGRMHKPGAPPRGVGAMDGDIGDVVDSYGPLPASLPAGAEPGDGALLIVTMATQPGEQSYAGVVVDYSIGPFKFTTVYGPSVTLSVQPLPPGSTCSADDDSS